MRLITDIFAFCRERVPRWNTISISGYHMREAGCTAVQEVAFTLANGIAYVQAALDAGLDVDEFAPQLSFFFNAHNNLLEEVAKFRAARRLWARIMRERFDARDPRSLMLRFHAQTAGSMLTAQQPENNIVRVAVQALAAVLGGCQSLHTNSMDEALSLPTEAAVRIALRTQQVLAHESGVADTVDPLGGSYAVERLTGEIEEEAETYIAKIDGLGGSVHAIPFMQREIQEAAYRYQQEVEAKARVVVGVNEFVMDEPPPAQPLPGRRRRRRQALAERLASLRAHARRRRGRARARGGGAGRARPRQPAARSSSTRSRAQRDARRDLRHAAQGLRCPPALGAFSSARGRRRSAAGRAARCSLSCSAPAAAGIADQVGATFGLMLQDVVSGLPADRRPGGRGGGRPASIIDLGREGRGAAGPGVHGLPQGRGLPASRSPASPSAATRRSSATPRSSARAAAVLRGGLRAGRRQGRAASPRTACASRRAGSASRWRRPTDLTKANADLRRVPFMLAHALEQTKRFQVVDPAAGAGASSLSQKTRERGAAGAARTRPWRSARPSRSSGWLVPVLIERRGVTYLDVTWISAVTGHGPLLPPGGPDPVRERGRAAVPLGAVAPRTDPRRVCYAGGSAYAWPS